MPEKIGQSRFQRAEILSAEVGFGKSAMHLERTDGRHHDHGRRMESRHAALDIQELLGTEVGTEACFRDSVIAQLHSHAGSHHGITAVRNVGKRSAVNEGGCSLQCLHQVRLDRVLEQCRHGADRTKLTSRHRLLIVGVADHNAGQALLQIGDGGGEAEDRHNLGRNRDVIPVLARHAVDSAAKSVCNKAQLTVIHIHTSSPCDFSRIDV